MIDIEDIARQEKDKYGSFFQNMDKNIVNLVSDLCEMNLKNEYELKEKLRELMRKYHVSPSKPQLCFAYDALVKHNIININPIKRK